jgi:ferredoxin-type protein NapH
MKKKKEGIQIEVLRGPFILLLIFGVIAVVFWQVKRNIFFLFNFGYIGLAIFIGLGLYAILPRAKKPLGRRVAQFLIGVYMLGFLGFILKENMQLEGFFFYLAAGIFAGAVIHYLVAKIFGPFLFGRGFCGWACWTAAVLDLLPYKTNKQGRAAARWERLRYLHFAASLGLILFLIYGFGYKIEHEGMRVIWWLIGGNAFYYASAVALAFVRQDNRAFCKYLCPITAFLKFFSRFAMLKIAGDASTCTYCGACARACPMDIDIPRYTRDGERVLSTECIFCNTCVSTCPEHALVPSFRFDIGGKEYIRRYYEASQAPRGQSRS